MPENDPVRQALKSHAALVDQTVSAFLADLEACVSAAQASLQLLLMSKLDLDESHTIKATIGNQRVLRRMPILWQQALDRAGFEGVIERYMDSFPAQIPAFQEVLQAVNYGADNPLPIPEFTAADKSYFNALKLSAGSDVSGLVENAAAATLTKTVYSLGTLSFNDLVGHLVATTNVSISRAESLADTSLQSFYRSVSGVAYDKIQAAVQQPLRYKYTNPRDRVTRPWCMDMLNKNKSYTKDEIMKMSNGQGIPVWTGCGGYRCRGTWLLQPLMGASAASA